MNDVNAACGEGDAADTTCQFDALATENPDIGSATKATGEKFVETTDALGEFKNLKEGREVKGGAGVKIDKVQDEIVSLMHWLWRILTLEALQKQHGRSFWKLHMC